MLFFRWQDRQDIVSVSISCNLAKQYEKMSSGRRIDGDFLFGKTVKP
jgi:hypothetical protein